VITQREKASLLRDVVYAANDGMITTFAIMAGVVGASLSSRVILILGFANLFADGFSMASGNYLGIKTEMEYGKKSGKRFGLYEGSPLRHGLTTFASFNIAGLLPLIPFVLGVEDARYYSIAIVFVSLFVVGAWRSKYSGRSFFLSGLEMFVVGGFAAFVAYGAGYLLNQYVI